MSNNREIRTFVTFDAEFPDDSEFAPGGDVICPKGRNIALALAEMLKSQGFAATEPQQHSYYGWQWTASGKNVKVWFLLQLPGPWLLFSQDKSNPIRKLFSSSIVYHGNALKKLNESLYHDDRFKNIVWYSKDEYQKQCTFGMKKGD